MGYELRIQLQLALMLMCLRHLLPGREWPPHWNGADNSVTLLNGAKLSRLKGGWWRVVGYHYCGDDVKGTMQLLQSQYFEYVQETRATQSEPPLKMRLYAYGPNYDGKYGRLEWW